MPGETEVDVSVGSAPGSEAETASAAPEAGGGKAVSSGPGDGSSLAWTAGAVIAAVALLVGLLLGVMLGGGGPPEQEGGPGGGGGDGPPPALVVLGSAETQSLRPRVAVEGRLAAPRRADVAGEVEGPIVRVLVDEGDAVFGPKGEDDPGTVLAVVDEVWLRQALAEATADWEAADAELRRSQNELDDLTSLRRGGAAQPQEVRDAQTDVASKKASVDAAKAAMERAETDLERASTHAPFDGVVVAKHAEAGQWMSRGGVVASIVSLDPIDAEIDVPESLVNAVKASGEGTVEVEVPALGRRIAAAVRSVNVDGQNPARTYPVKLSIDNPEGLLKPGMTVTAYPPRGPEGSYLTVPRDAVQFDEKGAVVWGALELQPGSGLVAFPAAVEVLFGEGERFAVRVLPSAGPPVLREGAAVIVAGAERLFPTQPLMPMEAAAFGAVGQPEARPETAGESASAQASSPMAEEG
ncbi:MAG: efflux RND transporter periplasmic adaptor subunit [Planctomycetota bacterium]